MIDAFVACGGKRDKSGYVRRETLIKINKVDFCILYEELSTLNILINSLARTLVFSGAYFCI